MEVQRDGSLEKGSVDLILPQATQQLHETMHSPDEE
jgi:hypothetical protein